MKICFRNAAFLTAVMTLIFFTAPLGYASPLSDEGGDYPREDSPSDMDQSGYTAADNSDLVNDWESQDVNPLSPAQEDAEDQDAASAPEVKKAKSKPQLIRIESMRREEALKAEKEKENPPAEDEDKEEEDALLNEDPGMLN